MDQTRARATKKGNGKDSKRFITILSPRDPSRWPPSISIAAGIVGAFQFTLVDFILLVRLGVVNMAILFDDISPDRVTFAHRTRALSRIALSNFIVPSLFSTTADYSA
ncbi:hypothetical protein PAXINDRAFT_101643 [Paxillus involutus ATCC 200175]|uniref:Uncharacterized protein n=1 Tax=Paxillus involutus ATCC 200175 TaxID=664439 RepID=A0A0C9TLG1_PAXIN|nr:hypothetical protein PAXINDRAFT_101643 [Paxillus involutus ATCC 200175]